MQERGRGSALEGKSTSSNSLVEFRGRACQGELEDISRSHALHIISILQLSFLRAEHEMQGKSKQMETSCWIVGWRPASPNTELCSCVPEMVFVRPNAQGFQMPTCLSEGKRTIITLKMSDQAWWHRTGNPALGSLKKKSCELKGSLY